MRRFFVNTGSIREDQVVLTGDESRHLHRVLRLTPGDMVLVFDGSGYEYQAELLSCSDQEVVGRIISRGINRSEPAVHITLVQGIAKGDKMDQIIQKSVELGISRIIPVFTQYTVVRLDQGRAREKTKRWNRIALEACKQCGRPVPPPVEPAVALMQYLADFEGAPGIILYEGCRDSGLREVLTSMKNDIAAQGIVVAIGPEGGFSTTEVEAAVARGFMVAGLGPRILRTETAGLAVLAAIAYEMGELGG